MEEQEIVNKIASLLNIATESINAAINDAQRLKPKYTGKAGNNNQYYWAIIDLVNTKDEINRISASNFSANSVDSAQKQEEKDTIPHDGC